MLLVQCDILGGDYDHGGIASRRVKEQLKRLGTDPAVIRRATIAAYEAEMNVVIHARKGSLRAQVSNGCIECEVVDEGPGIPDVELAMREGYSTAPATARDLGFGAGLGLPNIRNNADHFRLETTVGVGTGVYFSLQLRPRSLYGTVNHSLRVEADRCRSSRKCLAACPTQAVRLRHDRPRLLDYLCIDCTSCQSVCEAGVWQVRGVAEDALPNPNQALIVDAPFLLQFAPRFGPGDVLAALESLGFARVHVLEDWHQALLAAVAAEAASTDVLRPLVAPSCPAALQLITLRFPSMIPQVSAYVSPVEAATTRLGAEAMTLVLSCPGQRSAVEAGSASRGLSDPPASFVLPGALRTRLDAKLHADSGFPRDARRRAGEEPLPDAASGKLFDPNPADSSDFVRVTGERNVLRALESAEAGHMRDFRVLEPWMCTEGCFGSPWYRLHPTVARHRWRTDPPPAARDSRAGAVRRERPLVPRGGLRLDKNMKRAMEKLARIDEISRTLPGSDCGLCGAPTCTSLAEDIALGRAEPDACTRPVGAKEPSP